MSYFFHKNGPNYEYIRLVYTYLGQIAISTRQEFRGQVSEAFYVYWPY